MTVNRTTLLDLPLPVTGTESGTWGDITNNGLTEYMDIAIAGMSNLTSANFTAGALTIETTEGNSAGTSITATSAQYAGFRVTSLAVNSTITVGNTGTSPARSYRLINADATYNLTFKATGQTGVTLLPGQSAVVAFNGTDYVIVGTVGAGTATDNAVARFDGTTGEILQNSAATIDDTGAATFVGSVNVSGTSASAADLKLYEDTDNGTNYVAFKSPASVASNVTWTLPSADGTNGQALTTNGSGTLAFSTISTSAATPTTLGTVYGKSDNGSPYETALGYQALAVTSGGAANVAVGYRAGYAITSGQGNIAIGAESVYAVTTGSNNIGIGRNALQNNTASNNVGIGYNALTANTTGASNVAVGYQAGNANLTNSNFVAIGYQAALNNKADDSVYIGAFAGQANTTGAFNHAVGYAALYPNTTGSNNTAFGYASLRLNTTGSNNVAVGHQALNQNTTASFNTAIGYQAGYSNTTGIITAIGDRAGYSNTTGTENVAIGRIALNLNTTGYENVAIGTDALKNNTTAFFNTAVGYQAATSNTTGVALVAIGHHSMLVNTTGNRNIAIGSNDGSLTSPLRFNQTGSDNIAIGTAAIGGNGNCSNNVAIGTAALGANTTASNNTAVGAYAIQGNSTGANNTALGYAALNNNTTASGNTAVGYQSLYANTTGPNNTALGYQALFSNTTADNNIAVGYYALRSATGAGNTAIGTQAGYDTVAVTTGLRNTLLGGFTRPSSATADSQIVIGYNLTGQGDSNVTIGSASGKIYNAFTVNATWTQTSDGTMKNIVGSDTLGLSFINRLNPIKFTWKPENELPTDHPYYKEINGKDTTTVIHGFIAQEVKAALDAEGCTTFNGWDQGPDGIQAISREMFISPLVKAVQELSAQVQALQAEIATLKGA